MMTPEFVSQFNHVAELYKLLFVSSLVDTAENDFEPNSPIANAYREILGDRLLSDGKITNYTEAGKIVVEKYNAMIEEAVKTYLGNRAYFFSGPNFDSPRYVKLEETCRPLYNHRHLEGVRPGHYGWVSNYETLQYCLEFMKEGVE